VNNFDFFGGLGGEGGSCCLEITHILNPLLYELRLLPHVKDRRVCVGDRISFCSFILRMGTDCVSKM